MRALAAALVVLLLAAPLHVRAQEDDFDLFLCPGTDQFGVQQFARRLDADAEWYTTLVGNTPDKRVRQFGRLHVPGLLENTDQRLVAQFPVAHRRLRGKRVEFMDLLVHTTKVVGGDVEFTINLIGTGAISKLKPGPLLERVNTAQDIADGYLLEDTAPATEQFFADGLVTPFQRAIDTRENDFSLVLSPRAPRGAPSHNAVVKKLTLRAYYCPAGLQ